MVWNLADSFVVNVTFDSGQSWAHSSVSSMSLTEKARLLKHEQGHYEIVAILARDMFIEMMALKNADLSSSAAVVQDVRDIMARFQGVAQPLQNLYDSTPQTNHSRNIPKQLNWDGYLNTALTQMRVPAVTAPDGATYKVPLLDVLASNGIRV